MLTEVGSPPQALTITAQRINKSWLETPYDELTEAPKLVRAQVSNVYEGDMEGESWEEYLMLYQDDRQCSFVSMERFIGSVEGRAGSFVMQGVGTYADGVVRGQLTIVPGSATGELTNLRGKGFFVAPKGADTAITLDCEMESNTN